MKTETTISTWKKVLIIGLCVLATAAAVFVGILVDLRYEEYHKTRYWDSLSRYVSPNILLVEGEKRNDYFMRLKDVRTGEFTTPKLEHIFVNDIDKQDSLIVFRTFDRLRGYLNVNTGQIIIPAQYNRAWNFREGIAAVLKDGVLSFISEKGELAFPTTFPLNADIDFYDCAFQFHNGLCIMRSWAGKWGMINTQGEWAIEPIYNSICTPTLGYRIVTRGDKYGLIKEDGTVVIPTEYDFIRVSSDWKGFVLAKDGLAKQIDTSLQVTVPFVYDKLYPLETVEGYGDQEYDEGYTPSAGTPAYWRYDVGYGSGVMDSKGNVIIPAKYYMVRMVNDQLFEAETAFDGEHILFNVKGQVVNSAE